MDYLQYLKKWLKTGYKYFSFKPYYKWITFNTVITELEVFISKWTKSFKPYYKWITFNTENL